MDKPITNATAIYTIMMLIFAAGMWAILAYGSTLRARPDLAGEWLLAPEGDPRQETLRAVFEQSGKFVRLRVANQTLDMQMTDADPTAPERIDVHGASSSVVLEKTPVPDVYRLTLDSPQFKSKRFTARNLARSYPRAQSAVQQQRQQQSRATQPASMP